MLYQSQFSSLTPLSFSPLPPARTENSFHHPPLPPHHSSYCLQLVSEQLVYSNRSSFFLFLRGKESITIIALQYGSAMEAEGRSKTQAWGTRTALKLFCSFRQEAHVSIACTLHAKFSHQLCIKLLATHHSLRLLVYLLSVNHNTIN